MARSCRRYPLDEGKKADWGRRRHLGQWLQGLVIGVNW